MPCDPPGEELDGCDEEPCRYRRDGLLEGLGGIGPLDDIDGPFADAAQRVAPLVAGIAAVGEEMAQPGEPTDNLCEQQRCPVTILDVGSVDYSMDQIALSVGQDMALAALIILPASNPRGPLLSVVFTLAIDGPCTGRGLPPPRFTRQQQQGVVDRLAHAHRAPAIKIMPHRGHGREQTVKSRAITTP
jgi:hypothetical protein